MMDLVVVRKIRSTFGSMQVGQRFSVADVEYGSRLVAEGFAEFASARQRWTGIDWSGCTVVIIASGPSLTVEQCAAVHAWRDANRERRRVMVINTTYVRALWADLLYACDERWWTRYGGDARTKFAGELWSMELETKPHYVKRIACQKTPGLCFEPGRIFYGTSSGQQALALAHQTGAKRVILLGYDMRKVGDATHWHGEHPEGLRDAWQPYLAWMESFNAMVEPLHRAGVEVINATPDSALCSFPQRTLQEALCLPDPSP